MSWFRVKTSKPKTKTKPRSSSPMQKKIWEEKKNTRDGRSDDKQQD